jgi:hypothetical protein
MCVCVCVIAIEKKIGVSTKVVGANVVKNVVKDVVKSVIAKRSIRHLKTYRS